MRFMQLCCKHNKRRKIRFERFSHRIYHNNILVMRVRIDLQGKFHTHVIYRKKEKQMAYAKSDNAWDLAQ